jgi:hypothetical protein
MVRFPLLFFSIALLAAPAVAGDRRYAVTDFDRVVVEGPYSVRLTVGSPSTATASGSQRALEAVSVHVQGTTLRVRRNPNAWGGQSGRPAEPATLVLTTRTLSSARLLGTGSLDLSGARGLRLDLAVEGSGRIRATGFTADNLGLAVRGTGSLDLQGSAGRVTADVQGSGSLSGTALTADAATIVSATLGEVSMTVRRTANVTASGPGEVTIHGAPACTLRGPSAGSVRCGAAR